MHVGDWYYAVTSTFEYLPALPIYRSRDLASWEHIGNVTDREVQVGLAGCPDGGGVFAPTIRHHEGTLYVIVSIAFSCQGRRRHARARVPDVADMLSHAREDITAFADFPESHWRKIWCTDEGVNRGGIGGLVLGAGSLHEASARGRGQGGAPCRTSYRDDPAEQALEAATKRQRASRRSHTDAES